MPANIVSYRTGFHGVIGAGVVANLNSVYIAPVIGNRSVLIAERVPEHWDERMIDEIRTRALHSAWEEVRQSYEPPSNLRIGWFTPVGEARPDILTVSRNYKLPLQRGSRHLVMNNGQETRFRCPRENLQLLGSESHRYDLVAREFERLFGIKKEEVLLDEL